MGMFDTVRVKCPKCDREVKFQSKAGDCHLNEYDAHEVPAVIAIDLDSSICSCTCGHRVRINMAVPIRTVVMVAI